MLVKTSTGTFCDFSNRFALENSIVFPTYPGPLVTIFWRLYPAKETGWYREKRKQCKGSRKNREKNCGKRRKNAFLRKALPTSANSTEVTWERLNGGEKNVTHPSLGAPYKNLEDFPCVVV